MSDIDTPIEVGFGEFVARLISETFDSVVTAQAVEAERLAEISAAACMDELAFAKQFVTEEEVDNELASRFPPRSKKEAEVHPHTVYARSAYTPPSTKDAENPPYQATLGIVFESGDYTKRRDSQILEGAVQKTRDAVRLRLAALRQSVMREMVHRGVPRVVVDSGRINGKLAFHLTTTKTETEQSDTKSSSATSKPASTVRPEDVISERPAAPSKLSLIANLGAKVALPEARILPNIKVLVRQADDRAPQTTEVGANVFGEVEITFKTVV